MIDHPGAPFPHYGEEQAAKARKKKISRILGWILFLIIASPFVGWFTLDKVADHQLERTIRKLRRAGYAVSLKELVPPPVPSQDNGAPYYEAAFALMKGAHDEAFDVELDLMDTPGADGKRQFLDVFDRYSEAFDLVRRARRRAACRFERQYDRWWEERRPEFQPVWTLARALSLRAERQVDEGRPEEALETLRDLWSLADAFREEPLTWSQRLRGIVFTKALEVTVRCSRTSVTGEDWQKWEELLPDPASIRDSVFRELRGELAFWAGDAREGHPYGLEYLISSSKWHQRLLGEIARPLLKLGSSKGLLRYQSQLSRLEHAEVASRESLLREDDFFKQGFLQISLIHFASGSMQGQFRRMTIRQAALAVARAGMECERAWLVDGSYPRTLTETDPMTGRALEFSLDGTSLCSRPPQGRIKVSCSPEEDGLVWNLLHVGD